MARKYVSKDTTKLYVDKASSESGQELLWGDGCEVLEAGTARTKVKARGAVGWVKTGDLGDTSLLELYFIDVGQGDGVLIRTPSGKHVMIDGGYKRDGQPTHKNAADFVDWKFVRDYGATGIHLDAMIVSHCDADHYGGLWDLLNAKQAFDLDAKSVTVDRFFHAGVSYWRDDGKPHWTGPEEDGFITRLLGDRTAIEKMLKSNKPELQGEWRQFIESVVAQPDCSIRRVSDKRGLDFDPGDGVSFTVLGPVQFGTASKPKLRSHGETDKNTNGNSVIVRLDYENVRILLTGDLNKAAQTAFLSDHPNAADEIVCDVAKGCHHGSDDVSYEFLEKAKAACTVISSGDNESYSHPQPTIVAASGHTGLKLVKSDKMKTPLVYSTEIARSVRLGTPTKVRVAIPQPNGPAEVKEFPADYVEVEYAETRAGDLKPRTASMPLRRTKVVPGIIYGLVNVRTDGSKVLCATRNEKNGTWDTHTFQARF